MEFKVITNRKEWRRREGKGLNHANTVSRGGSDGSPGLQFFRNPPEKADQVSMAEFEILAKDRLKMLTVVEQIGAATPRTNEDYPRLLTKKLRELEGWDFLTYNSSRVSVADRQKDHLSHYILKLVCSHSEDRRNWLIQQEVDLFRYRFGHETVQTIKEVLACNDLHYDQISQSEKLKMVEELKAASNRTAGQVETTDFYKISCFEVLDLVRTRKAYLCGGYAYISRADMVTPVVQAYKTHLKKTMALVCRAHPIIKHDDRLTGLLSMIRSESEDSASTANFGSSEEFTASQINSLSRYFPLCMQQTHEHLTKVGHMKHEGRLQYSLFLKAMGLPLKEAMKYWKTNFAKGGTDGDQFDKKYAYGVRFNYGQEGKRVSYSPFSCLKVINKPGPSAPDQCHGCPYKQFDAPTLQLKFAQMGLKGDAIEKIMAYKKDNHYQLACSRHFEALHKLPDGSIGIQHPNQFFEEGRKIEAAKTDGTGSQDAGVKRELQGSPPSQGEPPAKRVPKEEPAND